MFLDGVLVPAGLLVDGEAILQETWRPRVTYHHIEIEGHGLLVSDGALTESYLDNGNRHLFARGAVVALPEAFAAADARGATPGSWPRTIRACPRSARGAQGLRQSRRKARGGAPDAPHRA